MNGVRGTQLGPELNVDGASAEAFELRPETYVRALFRREKSQTNRAPQAHVEVIMVKNECDSYIATISDCELIELML